MLGWLAVLLASTPLPAQEPIREVPADSVAALDLPTAVARAVVDFWNDPRRTRFTGPTHIEAGEVQRGDVAVLEGALSIAGRVEGSVLVIHGDVRFRPGAVVTGDVLVVGGGITGLDGARVHGEVSSYGERLSYRREGKRIEHVPPSPRRGRAAPRAVNRAEWGHSDFLISTGKSYNRVEGLPITFGPRIQTEGSNPLRVHALAIYRTESGFTLDTEQMGYYVRLEQFVGGRRELRVGATAHSLVDAIEEWHLSDLENGLSTFLFHRDFRDHYEREGISAFVSWEPGGWPLSLAAETRWERHRSLAAGSPWTLFDNTRPWREQPLVAEGRVGMAALQATLDSRSTATDPSTGWYVRGRVERAIDSSLERPEAFGSPTTPGGPPSIVEAERFGSFSTGLLDVRRYNRVDPESRLNFRLLLAGSLQGSPLPPQRQHALGGEGSLPGYELFGLDCAARNRVVYRDPEEVGNAQAAAFVPRYGCDAVAMLQAEYRGRLALRLRWDSAPWQDDRDGDSGWGVTWDISPDWVVFVDAGRGWAFDDTRPHEDVAADAGFGLLVDRIGLYVAKPLTGRRGLNFFVRLGPRF